MDFLALVKRKANALGLNPELLGRPVNQGFSGGEKKRNEILQMSVLEPRLAILDETDSGLDIDALREVASAVQALRAPSRAIVVITHHQRLLDYLVPDRVHVLSAGTIVMNQRSGDVQAEGNVASAHEPDTRKQTASMLSPAETFQATAGRMFLEGASRRIRYEGNAVVWQGGNRIEADRIEIDRAGQELAARGNVRTRLVGTPGVADAKAAPMVTSVRAPEMDYAEKTHTAVYRGGVTLTRGPTQVTSTELRGIFASAPGASALEKAIADGNVVILQSSGGRVRKGVAEHAEYALTEEKVTLSGGTPEFTDSWRGSTRGTQLTWFSGNGRLLVNGRDDQPAVSVIRRK